MKRRATTRDLQTGDLAPTRDASQYVARLMFSHLCSARGQRTLTGMPKRASENRSLTTAWERIDHPNTEDRIMSVFELLFSDSIKSTTEFDKQPECLQDEKQRPPSVTTLPACNNPPPSHE
jgi:hypothetical protein